MTPPQPGADLAPIIDWSEYSADAIDGQALTDNLKKHRAYAAANGLTVVPTPALPDPLPADRAEPPVVAPTTLRAHIEGVEAIADTIEGLDDETLSDADRDELSAMLIGAIAGTQRKVDATANVFAMFEGLEASARLEKERLARRETFYARQIQRLTDYVSDDNDIEARSSRRRNVDAALTSQPAVGRDRARREDRGRMAGISRGAAAGGIKRRSAARWKRGIRSRAPVCARPRGWCARDAPQRYIERHARNARRVSSQAGRGRAGGLLAHPANRLLQFGSVATEQELPASFSPCLGPKYPRK